jgi:hypothetical protein
VHTVSVSFSSLSSSSFVYSLSSVVPPSRTIQLTDPVIVVELPIGGINHSLIVFLLSPRARSFVLSSISSAIVLPILECVVFSFARFLSPSLSPSPSLSFLFPIYLIVIIQSHFQRSFINSTENLIPIRLSCWTK